MEAEVLTVGDHAVSVQMGNEISLEVNGKVLALKKSLEEHPIPGISELVPTYASLMVHYRPEEITFEEIRDKLKERTENLSDAGGNTERLIREIPVCYGGEYGPDLEHCAELQGSTPEEIIRMHSSHDYYVYMLGFAPGHPYLARFEEPYSFARRETARIKIPARSVVVQKSQCVLIPFDEPSGWNILGKIPLDVTNYKRKDPFLVHAGEWVRFIPVSQEEYQKIRSAAEEGSYEMTVRKE